MIATPSSSTAMMKVSRNWPSGIIGRMSIAAADAADPGEPGDSSGFAAMPLQADSAVGIALFAFQTAPAPGTHLLGYVPPPRTPGMVPATGGVSTASACSCSCGAPL